MKTYTANELQAALEDMASGSTTRVVEDYLEEANIAWYETGLADEARTDSSVANSQDEWEWDRARDMIEQDLRRKIM